MSAFYPEQSLSTFRYRRRTPGTFVLVPDPKRGRSIRCQGQLEAAAANILVACPAIQAIQEQPVSIWYAWRDDNPQIALLAGPPTTAARRTLRCSYIVPDFLATMKSGLRRLMEIKPSSRLTESIVQRKLAVAKQFAAQQGWEFFLVTEQALGHGSLLANVRLLSRFRKLVANLSQLQPIVALVSQQPVALAALLDTICTRDNYSFLKTCVLHLIAVGQLDIDLMGGPISDHTLLFPGGTLVWDPFDSVWGPSGSSTGGPSASSADLSPRSSSSTTLSSISTKP
jgi:TnsA endonuclease N terminal